MKLLDVGKKQISLSSEHTAAHLNISRRQVNWQISDGMPTSSFVDADNWIAQSGSSKAKGVAKRKRSSGELTAKAMASALSVSETRVHQLWKDGMSRDSIQDARDFRSKMQLQSISHPANSVDYAPDEDSSSSDSSFDCLDEEDVLEGGRCSESDSDSDSDNDDAVADVADPMALRMISRTLSGVHSICPQLMDLCIEGGRVLGTFLHVVSPI